MNQLKVLLSILILSLAFVATAQQVAAPGHVVSFARGEGVLRNHTDFQAKFAFRVVQKGDRPAEGGFQFSAPGPEGTTITISTREIRRLAVHGNEATFGGHAALEVTSAHGTQHFRGLLVVKVKDNVRVGDGRDRRVVDQMEVTFTIADTDRSHTFAGWADHRSIEVGKRRG